MQAACAQCSQLIAVDDAKAPAQAFSVKCPKCGSAVKFPGREAGPTTPAPAAPTPAPTSAAPRTSPRDSAMLTGRALVAIPQAPLAASLAAVLTRAGLSVDTSDDWEEGARLVDQGVYDYTATVRAMAAPGRGESLYQRILRMPSEVRRGVFLILAGDDFRTGDGTQAYANLADLVVNPADATALEPYLRSAVGERTRLYAALRDAKRRIESTAAN